MARAKMGAVLAALVLIVGLRLVALRSDPYPRLDWSAGLLTDEGFYIHNARNVALFGHARTDEFNNMLLSPLLHFAQTAIFAVFGVGSLQARMIGVACSLLMLWLFWAALRRAFDNRIALTATLFLGLDHTNLLYNRMALMDTPAALGVVAAFYALMRAFDENPKSKIQNPKWLALCGALLGLTVVNRTLCLYLLPVPFLALVPAFAGMTGRWALGKEETDTQSPNTQRPTLWLLLPVLLVFALYFAVWYAPNRAEIAAMNRYYRTEQIQPKSWAHLGSNLYHAALGDYRGLSPYLFRHTPILFSLALLWVVGNMAWGNGKRDEERTTQSPNHPITQSPNDPMTRYLTAWLLLGWGLLAVIGYSPSRYYVTTYPALAALAALALWRLPELWVALQAKNSRARILRGALIWFLAYHAVEAVVHQRGVLPRIPTLLLLYGLPTTLAILDFRFWILDSFRSKSKIQNPKSTIYLVLALWALANAYWLGDWAWGMRWTQYDMSRWLAENLPARSVLIGDVAPGVCLDNPFVAVNVIPKLCNSERPVEKFAGRPRYVVILDGRWKEGYWLFRHPEAVAPERRIKLARVLRWDVGVYEVNE
jgi:4-amino-4-deoxy-L-arabinose transferase-like glycosyltransferase